MKTIKNDITRKRLFDCVIENHYQDNRELVKYQLTRFTKFDLIKFVNYLHLYHNIYIDINGKKELDLFSTR